MGGHGEQVFIDQNVAKAVPEENFIEGGHMSMRWEN